MPGSGAACTTRALSRSATLWARRLPSTSIRTQCSGATKAYADDAHIQQMRLCMGRPVVFLLVAACVLQPHLAPAQGLTGALIGTVKDAQGGVLAGAVVRVSSP